MNDNPIVEAFDPAAAGWEAVEGIGFGKLIGPLWRRVDGEQIHFGFVVAPKHVNRANLLHGGMLMTFADQALGLTGRRASGGKSHATAELNIHFIGAVQVGEFVEARCEVVRATRSLIFMAAKMFVGTRIVGTANGIWKIIGA
jgi:uncharacterized protein (TIGR00369 family)